MLFYTEGSGKAFLKKKKICPEEKPSTKQANKWTKTKEKVLKIGGTVNENHLRENKWVELKTNKKHKGDEWTVTRTFESLTETINYGVFSHSSLT